MTDLRTLAQAVVDAPDDDEARYALGDALGYPRDSRSSVPLAVAEAIIAVDAQGYARAMGEVVERCDASVADNAKGRRWDPYTMGLCDEMDRIVEWARERATAAERD